MWGPAPGEVYVARRRAAFHRHRPRRRARHDPAAARLRGRPDRHVPRPRPAAAPPLPRLLPLAATPATTAAGAPTPSSTSASTARSSGCRARRWPCRPACFPDAALGDVPLFYPFVVNDPGEGTQAKRRAHAVIVDHLPAAADPGRHLRRPRPPRAAARRLRPGRGAGPGQAAGASGPRCGTCSSTAEIHRDLDLGDAPPDDDVFDDMILHVDGYLCALKDAQIRGGLHVLGAPPAGERAGRHRARRSPACPRARCRRCGRRSPPSSASTSPTAGRGRRRPRRGGVPRPGRGAGRHRLGRRTPTTDPTLRVGRRPARARPAAHDRRDRQPARRPRRPPRARRPERRAEPRRRPRAADRPQLLLRRPEGDPVAAGVGGRPGAGRPRSSSATSPRPAPTPRTVASSCGAPPPCAPGRRRRRGPRPARRAARRGTSRLQPGRPASRSIPLAELGRPRVDVTLRIAGFFRDAFPHVVAPARRRRRPGRRRSTSTPTQNPVAGRRHRRRPAVGPAARRLRLGHPAAHRAALVAHRRRPRRGVPGVVRLRLRPRRATAAPRPRRCAGGSPPSRSRSRTRTTASTTSSTPTTTSRTTAAWSPRSAALTGTGAEGLVRRLRRPGRPAGPLAGRGGGPGRAHPGAQPASGSTPCAATATRGRSSWPPPSTTSSATTPPPTSSRTGCTSGSPRPTSPTRAMRQVLRAVQPVGAAVDRRAAAGGRRPRHVGRHRRAPARRCATRSSRPRAGRSAR